MDRNDMSGILFAIFKINSEIEYFSVMLNIYFSLFFSLGHALWYAGSSSLTRDQNHRSTES